jgi:hypothetical protein
VPLLMLLPRDVPAAAAADDTGVLSRARACACVCVPVSIAPRPMMSGGPFYGRW